MLSSDAMSISTENHLARWNVYHPTGTPVVITYSFMTAVAGYDLNTTTPVIAFNDIQKQGVRNALDLWEEVGGLTFLELEEGGDLRLSMIGEDDMTIVGGNPAAGFAYLPFVTQSTANDSNGNPLGAVYHDTIGGDVFLNADLFADSDSMFNVGEGGFETVLHELGHALGLEHPFDGDHLIDPDRDSTDVTVLSYTEGDDPSTLGTADVEVIQFLYGEESFEVVYNEDISMVKIFGTSASEFIHGSTQDDFFSSSGGEDTVYGSDGDDFALFTNDVEFDGGNGRDTAIAIMGENYFTDSGGVFQLDPPENDSLLIDDFFMGGFGDDVLVGRLGNDVLVGDRPSQFLAGSDFLFGGNGSDFLQGGAGEDFFYFQVDDDQTADQGELGPDVIGYVDENTLNSVLNSNDPNIGDLIDAATQDFVIGVDTILIDSTDRTTVDDVENDFANFLRNTADGVIFENDVHHILFVGLTEADMLSVGVGDIFAFA